MLRLRFPLDLICMVALCGLGTLSAQDADTIDQWFTEYTQGTTIHSAVAGHKLQSLAQPPPRLVTRSMAILETKPELALARRVASVLEWSGPASRPAVALLLQQFNRDEHFDSQLARCLQAIGPEGVPDWQDQILMQTNASGMRLLLLQARFRIDAADTRAFISQRELTGTGTADRQLRLLARFLADESISHRQWQPTNSLTSWITQRNERKSYAILAMQEVGGLHKGNFRDFTYSHRRIPAADLVIILHRLSEWDQPASIPVSALHVLRAHTDETVRVTYQALLDRAKPDRAKMVAVVQQAAPKAGGDASRFLQLLATYRIALGCHELIPVLEELALDDQLSLSQRVAALTRIADCGLAVGSAPLVRLLAAPQASLEIRRAAAQLLDRQVRREARGSRRNSRPYYIEILREIETLRRIAKAAEDHKLLTSLIQLFGHLGDHRLDSGWIAAHRPTHAQAVQGSLLRLSRHDDGRPRGVSMRDQAAVIAALRDSHRRHMALQQLQRPKRGFIISDALLAELRTLLYDDSIKDYNRAKVVSVLHQHYRRQIESGQAVADELYKTWAAELLALPMTASFLQELRTCLPACGAAGVAQAHRLWKQAEAAQLKDRARQLVLETLRDMPGAAQAFHQEFRPWENHDSKYMRLAALGAAATNGDADGVMLRIDKLLAQKDDDDWHRDVIPLIGLAGLSTMRGSVDRLERLLAEHPDPFCRRACLEGMQKWRQVPASGIEAVRRALEDADKDVRWQACRLLGRWGHRSDAARAALQAVRDDEYLGKSAREYLQAIDKSRQRAARRGQKTKPPERTAPDKERPDEKTEGPEQAADDF